MSIIPELEILQVFVHTDAGREIDDEIAVGIFLRELICSNLNRNINLVLSVETGIIGVKRLIDIGLFPIVGLILNSEWNFENIIPIKTNKTITLIFHNGKTFVPDSYQPHYIGSISPGLDLVLKPCNLSHLHGFSHQGLLGNPGWYGFNETGETKMLMMLKDSNVSHKLATPLECFSNFLFSHELFKYYNIPENVWITIAGDAFRNIIGRMPPTVPEFVKPLFETLVNLELADACGKPGTNKRLTDAIYQRYTGPIVNIDETTQLLIWAVSINYVDSFPTKDRDNTIKSVYELTFKLAEMGMPFIKETPEGPRLIYSSDGDLATMYPIEFEQFYKIGIFTPAYDLKALENLKELILEHNTLL